MYLTSRRRYYKYREIQQLREVPCQCLRRGLVSPTVQPPEDLIGAIGVNACGEA